MPQKLATFRIDGDEWSNFLTAASERGTTATAVLKAAIQQYLVNPSPPISPERASELEVRVKELERRMGFSIPSTD